MDCLESDERRDSSVLTEQTGTHNKQIVHPGLIVTPPPTDSPDWEAALCWACRPTLTGHFIELIMVWRAESETIFLGFPLRL